MALSRGLTATTSPWTERDCNLAEAQLKFRTGVALMRLENQRVMDAIHADK